MTRDLEETGRGFGDLVMGPVPIRSWRMKGLVSAYSSTEEVKFLPVTIYLGTYSHSRKQVTSYN